MNNLLLFLGHLVIVLLLTIITQIGDIVYLLALITYHFVTRKTVLKFVGIFVTLYSIATYILVPVIAPQFGRMRIQSSSKVKAHNVFYPLLNRNYVSKELHSVLINTADEVSANYPDYYIHYLDANFPFIDGFPLFPHLSHNDGKKIDISFAYEDVSENVTNQTASLFGYGVFENEKGNNLQGSTQNQNCKKQGHWQYDIAKYLSLGYRNDKVEFSENSNTKMLNSLCALNSVSKIFIEPHLKTRLNLTNSKIRFHGCWAVRHDDHIHIEVL